MATATVIPAWLAEHYEDFHELGKGAYGSVVQMREKSGWWIKKREVACKILDLEKESILHEAEIMKTLRGIHGVVSLRKCHKDPTCSCMVMELCECNLVTAMCTGFVPYDKAKLAVQFGNLVQTVKAMHKRGVLHRDLKPDNILVTKKKELKVADFGTSVHFTKGTKLQDVTGTWLYMAPEMVMDGSYDEKVDVYALGLILYYMLELKKPFEGYDPLDPTFFRVRKLKFEQASNRAVDLINGMTRDDPKDRLTLDEVLKQPWFKTHGF